MGIGIFKGPEQFKKYKQGADLLSTKKNKVLDLKSPEFSQIFPGFTASSDTLTSIEDAMKARVDFINRKKSQPGRAATLLSGRNFLL